MLEKTLTSHGFKVTIALDGLHALECVDDQTPDLALVDIMIPRLDGVTFVEAIKSRPKTESIVVIFLSSKNDPPSIARGIEAGAKYYVTKPFQIDELLNKVDRALKSRNIGR